MMMRFKKSSLCVLGIFGGFCLILYVYHIQDDTEAFHINSVEKSPRINQVVGNNIDQPNINKKRKTSIKSSLSSSSSSSGPIKKQLLLITKGRSGSSFTSALVNNDSQVMYSFEPLYPLVKMKLKGAETSALKKKAYELLRAFIECDFSDVTGRDIVHNNQLLLSGPETETFYKCMRHEVTSGWRHLDCLYNMVQSCKTKMMTFAKILRIPVSWVEPLFPKLPHLKILYLIRDPRPVLLSQARTFNTFKWPDEVETAAQGHCGSIEDDIADIERLALLYPGRFHVIKYERGATEPMEYAKDIYRFAGLNFTKQTAEFVESLSSPIRDPQYAYGLHRKNGTKTMNNWRTRVSYDAAKKIDKICYKVYEKMGYRAVTSRHELRSESDLFSPYAPMESVPESK